MAGEVDWGLRGLFFFSSRRRHTRWNCDWSSDVCSSDLYVPRYAFNWHVNYVYAKGYTPVLPKGTIIKTTAWHDNTTANKFNPDPAQWVTYGQRSVDEMAHANEVRSEERRVGKECRWRGS